MLSRIISCGLHGIDGYIVEVESYISGGLPDFDIVGLADAAVRESKERVRAAIKNSGFEFARRRITVNLAPANMRKEGSIYDLSIALAILAATGQVSLPATAGMVFLGELSLDGGIRKIDGALSMALCAKSTGQRGILLPAQNSGEAAVVKGIDVYGAASLIEVIDFLNGDLCLEPCAGICDFDMLQKDNDAAGSPKPDFSDVKGQNGVKRALEIAASGSHNCLMIGPPGSGKSMLAGRLPGILPDMTFEEALEVTKIYSISGLLPSNIPLITQRPFRSPHHSVTQAGLIGGGKYPKPGEISLAHNGVLFLDEVTEYGGSLLETLRQPLEEGKVHIARLNATLTFPASVTLICAANPCRCGNRFEKNKKCTCTPGQLRDYMNRLSGPLLDRIDIHIEAASVVYDDLSGQGMAESSAVIRKRVNRARKIQTLRYYGTGIYSNSQLTPSMLDKYCRPCLKGEKLLKRAFDKLGLSARAYGRILKVSRTIADMDDCEEIQAAHIAEAIQYRTLDRRAI
ncbi:MAG: YifB family Mg chelatase-like AAA ATPase [Eubacteriales bacterium]|nr:YifB family Mg chelatase-like AAA ATPase [Eubacteriales bacterium]